MKRIWEMQDHRLYDESNAFVEMRIITSFLVSIDEGGVEDICEILWREQIGIDKSDEELSS